MHKLRGGWRAAHLGIGWLTIAAGGVRGWWVGMCAYVGAGMLMLLPCVHFLVVVHAVEFPR